MTFPLRVLLIGNGGREHTLAWKLAQSPQVEAIHVVPGNGGTAGTPKCENITSISAEDFASLAAHAKKENLNLLVPGPEAPLVAGIVDYFQEHAPDISCFGPVKAAARLEGSKTFSKDFMHRHSIPTARYANFTEYESARKYLDTVTHPIVIKADGLAAGKGVIIPASNDEAQLALKDMMLEREFGSAGDSVVIEEFLTGSEISVLTLTDGITHVSLPAAQDHKRIGDGDTGPNTGGMGTYAPAPVATPEVLATIDREVLAPTLAALREAGTPFVGCLFSGFMLTEAGPRTLEYNVRFGDPETQSCLSLLRSDLAELMWACTQGKLAEQKIDIADGCACTVVVAAGGYPGSYSKGTQMSVTMKTADDLQYFHAGTSLKDGKLVTNGGRVIAATATGKTLKDAVDRAYEGVKGIEFDGMQYRKDIAHRALKQ